MSAAAGVEHDLLILLRDAVGEPSLAFDGEPIRLTGGFWAELISFRLLGAPAPWDGRLVARLMPDATLGARETVVQAEVAEQGFATPRVHLAGSADDGLGRAFMVMDHAEGSPLLAGLSGGGAIARLPALARRIPDTLASAMASLHRIDVGPIRERLATLAATADGLSSSDGDGCGDLDSEGDGDQAPAGAPAGGLGDGDGRGDPHIGLAPAGAPAGGLVPSVQPGTSTDTTGSPYTTLAGAGDGMPAFVTGLEAAAQALGRADLVGAARWLAAHPPAPAADVVCHGDLHPFNVLIADDGAFTVLDWSAANLAPAAYDAAFTSLVLSEPPLYVPRAVRPIVRAAGRMLARRFLRSYQLHSGAPFDAESLRWHQGVVSLRALVEVAHWVVAGQLDSRRGHPWLISGPAFASRLSKLTGQPIHPRDL